jgi:hypothetical protein
MEITLKNDILSELSRNDGSILLHDEVEQSPGNFQITSAFEKVESDEVLTPREVFEKMQEEFEVDYERCPVTDEQVRSCDCDFFAHDLIT